jgi:hypothetical protein
MMTGLTVFAMIFVSLVFLVYITNAKTAMYVVIFIFALCGGFGAFLWDAWQHVSVIG